MHYLKRVQGWAAIHNTTTLASNERACHLLKLATRQCTTIGDFDQHPSLPHDVGVTVGVNVRVGVRVAVGVVGVFVCVGLRVGDGVNVFVAVPVLDGVSVMVGVMFDGVRVLVGVIRVGVGVCDAVGGLNRSVSTMRVYCGCGSLSCARIVIV
jgi:hypothetical protein